MQVDDLAVDVDEERDLAAGGRDQRVVLIRRDPDVPAAEPRSAPQAALVLETQRLIQTDGAHVRFDDFERDSNNPA